MTFSTYLFLFLFLPLSLLGYFALSRAKNPVWQRLFLLAASLVFIGYAGVLHLVWLLASGTLAYLFALWLGKAQTKAQRKTALVLGVVIQVGLLAYCKYYNFFAENLLPLFGKDFTAVNIFLPLGISFFTFQQLMLLVNVYQEKYRVGSPLTYALLSRYENFRAQNGEWLDLA